MLKLSNFKIIIETIYNLINMYMIYRLSYQLEEYIIYLMSTKLCTIYIKYRALLIYLYIFK